MEFEHIEHPIIENSSKTCPIFLPEGESSDGVINTKTTGLLTISGGNELPIIEGKGFTITDGRGFPISGVKKIPITESKAIIEQRSLEDELLIKIFQKYTKQPIREIEPFKEWIHKDFDQIDWDEVSANENLVDTIMEEFAYKLNWDILSASRIWCGGSIREFYKNLNLKIIIKTQQLPNELITLIIADIEKDLTDTDLIHILNFQHTDFRGDNILTIIKRIQWLNIKEEFTLPDLIITKFSERNVFMWSVFSQWLKFSQDIMQSFYYKIDWNIYCKRQLSHETIRDFKKWMKWELVSQYSNLSDKSLKLFKKELIWDLVIKCQTLSQEWQLELSKEYHPKLISFYQANVGKLYKAGEKPTKKYRKQFKIVINEIIESLDIEFQQRIKDLENMRL